MTEGQIFIPAITLRETQTSDENLSRLNVAIKIADFITFLQSQPGEWLNFEIVRNRQPRGHAGYTHSAKMKAK